MVRPLRYTEPFRKDVARLRRRGADFACFKRAVACLSAGTPLPACYDDRPVYRRGMALRLCRLPGCGYLLYRVAGGEVILVRLFGAFSEPRRRVAAAPSTGAIMLRNDLKMAFRHVARRKGFALLNVTGLAAGLACCLLMLLFVRDELGYDRFHERAGRIYRVVGDESKEGGIEIRSAATPARLGTAVAEHFPEVEAAVRFLRYAAFNVPLVRRDGTTAFQEPGFFFADSTVFDVFSFAFVRGDPATALDRPFSVVLTASAARKYFGAADPIGQTLRFEERHDFTVTGVVRDLPSNTHMRFDLLAAFSSLRRVEGDWIFEDWHWPPVYTYVLLREGSRAAALAGGLPAFTRRYLPAGVAAQRRYALQPLADIHLRSHREQEWTPSSDVAYVYLFSAVALFVLVIACINFVNLSTARSAQRAKEVGVRKVLGAQRRQLVRQFMGESMLAVAVAVGGALGLAALAMPLFNDVAGKAFTVGSLFAGPAPLALAGIALATGLLAGLYPALYLSAFRPAQTLKGGFSRGGPSAAALRKGLVVLQFGLSCLLLVGTAVVYRQLDFLQRKQLGFDREHVAVVRLPTEEAELQFATLKARWAAHPGVRSVTAASAVPPETEGLYDFPVVLHGEGADSLEMLTLAVDHDFAETFGLDVVAGRDFSEAYGTDAAEAFVLNESAARKLGLEAPVGRALTLYHYAGPAPKTGRVVGVVRDFHYRSLHHAITPIVFYILPVTHISYYGYLAVRLEPTDVEATLAALARDWAAFLPGRPFDVTFLDAHFDALYRAEQRLATLFGAFALLTLVVACLGLFGLAAYTAEQRTKEIGVRKILGASVAQVVVLLSKEFVRLVALAFVLAAPLAYAGMHRWLDGFAYRTVVSWDVFALAGGVALGIALVTVSTQALRAALADPVRALRHE